MPKVVRVERHEQMWFQYQKGWQDLSQEADVTFGDLSKYLKLVFYNSFTLGYILYALMLFSYLKQYSYSHVCLQHCRCWLLTATTNKPTSVILFLLLRLLILFDAVCDLGRCYWGHPLLPLTSSRQDKRKKRILGGPGLQLWCHGPV